MARFRSITPLGSQIDREAGLIKGVAIITQGPAKGHGMLCDGATVSSVRDAIVSKYASGLKVKFNPETWNHGDGSVIGRIPVESLKVDNDILRGDLHVMKSYSGFNYVFEAAESMGDTFGLSIDFENTAENIGGVDFARCTDIYAVTIVDEPAANHAGLFSVGSGEQKPKPANKDNAHMALTEEDKTFVTNSILEAMRPVAADVAGLKQAFNAKPITLAEVDEDELFAAGIEETDTEEQKLSKVKAYRAGADKPVTQAGLAAIMRRTLTGFVAEVGGRPAQTKQGGAPVITKGRDSDGKTAFTKKVEELEAAGLSKAAATRSAVSGFGALYKEHCELRTGAVASK